jgi:hypothetical protein
MTTENSAKEELLTLFEKIKAGGRFKLLMSHDVGEDIDDALVIMFLINLIKHGCLAAEDVCTIAVRTGTHSRALLTDFLFSQAGIEGVLIGEGNNEVHGNVKKKLWSPEGLAEKKFESASVLGRGFLDQAHEEKIPVIVWSHGTVYDLAELFAASSEDVIKNIKNVIVQGGIEVVDNKLVPDMNSYNYKTSYIEYEGGDAANYASQAKSNSEMFINKLVENDVPIIFSNREDTLKLSKHIGQNFIDLLNTDHPLYNYLKNSAVDIHQGFWKSGFLNLAGAVEANPKNSLLQEFSERYAEALKEAIPLSTVPKTAHPINSMKSFHWGEDEQHEFLLKCLKADNVKAVLEIIDSVCAFKNVKEFMVYDPLSVVGGMGNIFWPDNETYFSSEIFPGCSKLDVNYPDEFASVLIGAIDPIGEGA